MSSKFSFGNSSPAQSTRELANPGSNDTRLFLVGIAIIVLLIIVGALLLLTLFAPALFRR